MEASTLEIQKRLWDLWRTWHPAKAPRTLISKEQFYDVKTKLDSVHKLLKKQISFAEDVEVVDVDSDMEEEEDHACTFIYAKKWGW